VDTPDAGGTGLLWTGKAQHPDEPSTTYRDRRWGVGRRAASPSEAAL